MKEKKWTLIDRKTMIALRIFIIIGIVVASASLISYMSLLLEEKDEDMGNYSITLDYDSRFFGTWINTSAYNISEYPYSGYTFYPNGTCITSEGEYEWAIKRYYGDPPSYYYDYIDFSDSYYGYIRYNFSDNNTLTLYYINTMDLSLTTKVYSKQIDSFIYTDFSWIPEENITTETNISFNASYLDPFLYGTIFEVLYSWDFGDGGLGIIETNTTTTHRYDSPGTYLVELGVIYHRSSGLTEMGTKSKYLIVES